MSNRSIKQYKVFLNHIGFLCDERKYLTIENGPFKSFEVQDMSRVVKELLENWSRSLGFRFRDSEKKDPYRGILHSAQPVIGLSLAGKVLKNKEMSNAAWDQIYWLFGNNTLNSCLVSSVGYNNPMPHRRFLECIQVDLVLDQEEAWKMRLLSTWKQELNGVLLSIGDTLIQYFNGLFITSSKKYKKRK